MERCPSCGVETRPGDQFCLNCGNRLAGSQPAAHPWGGPQAPAQGGTPPVQNAPWFGGPGAPPGPPTAPTVQTINAGIDQTNATAPDSDPAFPAPDDPTVVTPEVLEPTVRPLAEPQARSGPATAEPEILEPTAQAPVAAMMPEDAVPPVTAPSLETRVAVEEEAEVTITVSTDAPAKLVVMRNGQTREFLLKKPDITIGRAPSNDVPLSGDQLASRRHALIRYDGVNFTIRDVGSANGTYINGVELRAPTPLNNGDHIGIGEHELIFFTVAANEEAEPPTITIPPPEPADVTYRTMEVPDRADTLEPSSPWATRSDSNMSGEPSAAEAGEAIASTQTDLEAGREAAPEAAIPTDTDTDLVVSGMPEATVIEVAQTSQAEVTEEVLEEMEAEEEEEEEEQIPGDRFYVEPVNEEEMPLPVPQLPEIPTVLSAIKSLDTTTAELREQLRQAKALEEQAQQLREQLKIASDMIANHDNAVAVLAQRLRIGVADVSNRLSKVIEEVTRADESLSIEELVKLIDDVRNDPRDIYTLGSLARRARELAQFFEMHQHVNQILSECLTTLNNLLSPDLAKPEGQE